MARQRAAASLRRAAQLQRGRLSLRQLSLCGLAGGSILADLTFGVSTFATVSGLGGIGGADRRMRPTTWGRARRAPSAASAVLAEVAIGEAHACTAPRSRVAGLVEVDAA